MPQPGEFDPDRTRAMPRAAPQAPRAWSQTPPGQQPPQPRRRPEPGGRGDQPPRGPEAGPRRYGPNSAQRPPPPMEGGYAPTQTPQPHREPRPAPQNRTRGAQPPAPPAGRAPRAPRKRHWGRRLGVLALVLLLAVGGFTLYLDSKMNRVDALADYEGRPTGGEGTNWLLVGSDSREGLSSEQQAELATGDSAGSRTDTIMVLHTGSGAPTLVSIPRDSYLEIPGQGRNKVNAAFAIGGPQLLAQTVEQATGLRMDHYAEIGFGGFAGVVDAVGGVEMCLDEAIDDPAAGINLSAGCQELDGANALGFVRTRHNYANQDLTRVQNQRAFLSSLLTKATSPSTLANPFKIVPLATRGVGLLTVGADDHVWNLLGLGRAIGSGELVNTTAPVAGTPTVEGAGSVVEWNDEQAQQLFGALAADQPVPSELLATG